MVKIRRKKLYPAFLFPFSILNFSVCGNVVANAPVVFIYESGVYIPTRVKNMGLREFGIH